jgi:hypothetical protein
MEAQLLNPEFVYTPIGTCITKRWREQGWIPASEDPEIIAKWQKIQALSARTTLVS